MQGEILQVSCLEFHIYALKFALTLFLVIHTELAYKDIFSSAKRLLPFYCPLFHFSFVLAK